MAWVWLFLAGLCEVLWAVGLKKYGFRFTPGSAATVVGMTLSFVLLSRAMEFLPLGTAYAIWTGIGAVGAAAVGMAFLGEPRDASRVACILLIVAGIVGLKYFSPPEQAEGPGFPVIPAPVSSEKQGAPVAAGDAVPQSIAERPEG